MEEENEDRRFPADEDIREPRPRVDEEVLRFVRCERNDTDRVKSVTELVRLKRLLSRRWCPLPKRRDFSLGVEVDEEEERRGSGRMRNEGGAASSSALSSAEVGGGDVFEDGSGGGGEEEGLGCRRPVRRAKTEEDGDGVVGGIDGGECDGGGGDVGER